MWFVGARAALRLGSEAFSGFALPTLPPVLVRRFIELVRALQIGLNPMQNGAPAPSQSLQRFDNKDVCHGSFASPCPDTVVSALLHNRICEAFRGSQNRHCEIYRPI